MTALDSRGPHIAILDADPAILEYLEQVLADRFSLSLYTAPEKLLESLGELASADLVLIDWHVAEEDTGQIALKLLSEIRSMRPSLPMIVLACTAELQDVVEVTRMGAVEVLLKPFNKSDIDVVVNRSLASVNKVTNDETLPDIPLSDNVSFVRSSKRMREIESQCTLVARADIPVLILGESGTGKEVAAMLIHKMSARSQKTFLKVNCAAMPADLLESELFGYEQGAFTGAVKSKPGKFEMCNNGTILLDEIGEMPTVLQAKLLQVLQDGSFSRLGGRASVKVDVRVIAATNIDIKSSIVQKTFREDLYYRLNGFTLKMPPLRERTEEIEILSEHFMRKVAAKYEWEPLSISPALLQALMKHTWPGNLRELENTIKRYLVLADEQAIIRELTPLASADVSAPLSEDADGNNGLKNMVRNLKGEAEAAAITQTLEGTGWNRKVAANDLQISYKALLYKIKQYNLTPPPKLYSNSHSERV